MQWSPQQQDFLDWCVDGKGSCVLEAVAGAGKTTVLLEGAQRIRGKVLYLAYNKPVASETEAKLKELGIDWTKCKASTVHAAGFGGITKAVRNVKVDKLKVRSLFELRISELFNDEKTERLAESLQPRMGEVLQLVSLAKQSAFGTAGPSIEDASAWLQMAQHFDVFDDETSPGFYTPMIDLAQHLLIESNKNLEVIDFDDMPYLPVLHKLPFFRYDVVMVDEAQDTNAARRALVRALVKKGGRVIAVGDPHQAIYGFTGADSDALDLIAEDFNCIRLPLTITYRCPKKVVNVARQWVEHITAADSAPEGSVEAVRYEDFLGSNADRRGEAVLCRVNKPLVALAFGLIRRRVPCQIAGRDIGGSLKKLLTRWKVTSLDKLEDRLDDHLRKQTTILLAKKQEDKVAQIEDQVETCKVIISACRENKKYNVQDAISWVDSMFTDENKSSVLMLSSVHKSKGREWKTVYWLDRAGTCPSKWARQKWQQEQEKNLQYVAATRSKDRLIDILVPPKPKEDTPY